MCSRQDFRFTDGLFQTSIQRHSFRRTAEIEADIEAAKRRSQLFAVISCLGWTGRKVAAAEEAREIMKIGVT
jgi:hypothetical protein